jgi:hypothetical protein
MRDRSTPRLVVLVALAGLAMACESEVTGGGSGAGATRSAAAGASDATTSATGAPGSGGGGGGVADPDGVDPLCVPGADATGSGGASGEACELYRATFCAVKADLGCVENGGENFPCSSGASCDAERAAWLTCLAEKTTVERCECGNDGEGGSIDNGAMPCHEDGPGGCGQLREALRLCVEGPAMDPFDTVAGCELSRVDEIPSEHSPTDGCDATYACDDGVELVVRCDGENDGSGTSLCSCAIGTDTRDAGAPVDGEGAEACLAALDACVPG